MIIWSWRVMRGDRRMAEGVAPNRLIAQLFAGVTRMIMEAHSHMFIAPFVGPWSIKLEELGDIRA